MSPYRHDERPYNQDAQRALDYIADRRRRVWAGPGTIAFHIAAIILAALALLLAGYAIGARAATGLGANVKATVVSVHDGDTIRASVGSKTFSVRVVGIDTPEIPPRTPECAGSDAAAFAKNLLYAGRPIFLQVDKAAGDHDRYGRKLRVIRFYRGRGPGRTYQRTVLLAGLANVYDYRKEHLALLSTWVGQRDNALKAQRGAWNQCPGPSGNGPSTNIYRAWSTGPVPTPASAAPVIAAPASVEEPSIGRLPQTGINDLTAATNHPGIFWGDYHALRMTWVRIVVPWASYQPTNASPDYNATPWRVADAFMARARDEGAHVLVSFGGVPAWARLHQPDEGLGSGARPDAYAAWIRLWLARYPQTSAVDQHEANCCSLSEYVATKDLARMLDASYPILRAAGVESIAGSWTEGGISGARARQAIRELGAIYHGRRPSFDSLGFHFYPSLWARKVGVELAHPAPTDSYLMTEFGRLQRDINAAFPYKPMRWSITETGWSTPGGYQGDALSPDQQAAAAVWELREASRYPRIERFMWFLDVDQSARAGTSNFYKSAIRNDDGSAKPIFDAWKALAS